MELLLAQVASESPLKIDWTQITASVAIIFIAVSWTVSSIQAQRTANADKLAMQTAMEVVVGRIHAEAKSERDANKANIDRVCSSFDGAIKEAFKLLIERGARA